MFYKDKLNLFLLSLSHYQVDAFLFRVSFKRKKRKREKLRDNLGLTREKQAVSTGESLNGCVDPSSAA